MNVHTVRKFSKSPTARLAATYLSVIMVMSIGFSIVLYTTSSAQLGRQLPPDSLYHAEHPKTGAASSTTDIDTSLIDSYSTQPRVNHFLQQRIEEGREMLLKRLFFLNLAALLFGGVISYILARQSLEPIEESMNAQAQFVSDASHELRTPLAAIQTSNEVFLRRAKPTLSDAKKLIAQNTEDVIRLKKLSDGLLNLAQYNQPDLTLKRVELQDVVSDAVTQIASQATKKSIRIEDETKPIQALGDAPSLTQALVILLDNAVKYSPRGQAVTLLTHEKGKHIYLEVRDQGMGIEAHDIPHLFQRFYRADTARTNSSQNGYGLGLAIAKRIMKNQHGDIDVTSQVGHGSTFRLKLLKPNIKEAV